jgi:membrane-associated protease RseP (regulator of RpoE activity)
MKANVGTIDRALRIIGGIVLITLAATGIFAPWGWIGVIPLLTGIFKFCPVYPLLGITTCPMEKK